MHVWMNPFILIPSIIIIAWSFVTFLRVIEFLYSELKYYIIFKKGIKMREELESFLERVTWFSFIYIPALFLNIITVCIIVGAIYLDNPNCFTNMTSNEIIVNIILIYIFVFPLTCFSWVMAKLGE